MKRLASSITLLISIVTIFGPLSMGVSSADTSPNGYVWGTTHEPNGTFNKSMENNSPAAVSGIPNQVVQVVSTNTDYYALDNTGAVWAWGSSQQGEIGASGANNHTNVSVPTQVQFPAGVTIASLPNPMPDGTALAIDSNGNVWGWGYNRSHELCLKKSNIDTRVMLPISNVTLASGAGDHALFYSNNTLYACGTNDDGDMGIGTTSTNNKIGPTQVIGLPASSVTNITTSYHNSGVLMNDGSYYDWGMNNAGQLGNGSQENSGVPVEVDLPTTATQVSVGGSLANNGQSIALLSDGSVWMWGNNGYGQLGNGSTTNASIPTPVDVPNGVTFDFVNSGGSSAYAIDTTGNAWSWGQNNNGQLGIGKANNKANPFPLSTGIQLSEISATSSNVYGL
jgi:alpha-tubulin suppressor-like RCC1 family protein